MGILAQAVLDCTEKFPDTQETKYCELVKHYLNPKTPLEQQALRIVYQDDIYGALREMVQAEQLDFGMICRNTRMPVDRIWLEWRDCPTNDGNLIDFGVLFIPNRSVEIAHDKLFLAFVFNISKSTNSIPRLSCVFATNPPPYDAGIPTTTKLLWCLDDRNNTPFKPELWKQLCALTIRTAVFALFLLNQPKLIVQQDVQYCAKQNAKRAKKGKPELINYTTTKIKFHILGSNIERLARQGKHVDGLQGARPESDKRGVRYHYVIGHFRCIHRGRSNEYLVWIEPHYRGDASKGVLIRERVLTKA